MKISFFETKWRGREYFALEAKTEVFEQETKIWNLSRQLNERQEGANNILARRIGASIRLGFVSQKDRKDLFEDIKKLIPEYTVVEGPSQSISR